MRLSMGLSVGLGRFFGLPALGQTVEDLFEGNDGDLLFGRALGDYTWTEAVNTGRTSPAILSNGVHSGQATAGVFAYLPGVDLEDVEITSNMRFLTAADGDRMALLARVDETNNNRYTLIISENSNYIRLSRINGGTSTTLQEVAFAPADNTTYEIRFELDGAQIQALIDDVLTIDFDDTGNELPSGSVGLGFVSGGTGATHHFEDFAFTDTALPAIQTPQPFDDVSVVNQLGPGLPLSIDIRLVEGLTTQGGALVIYEATTAEAESLTMAQVLAGEDHTGTPLPAEQTATFTVLEDGSVSSITLSDAFQSDSAVIAIVSNNSAQGGTLGNGVWLTELGSYAGARPAAYAIPTMIKRTSGAGTAGSKMLAYADLRTALAGDKVVVLASRNAGPIFDRASVDGSADITFDAASPDDGGGKRIGIFEYTMPADGSVGSTIELWNATSGVTSQLNLTAAVVVVKAGATVSFTSDATNPLSLTTGSVAETDNTVVAFAAGQDAYFTSPQMHFSGMDLHFSENEDQAGAALASTSGVATGGTFTTTITRGGSGSFEPYAGVAILAEST